MRAHVYAGGDRSLTQGVMFVDEIVDMDLLLHISFDKEELNEQLFKIVRHRTVILGRNEDIGRVDYEGTALVEITPFNGEYRLPYSIYIEPNICEKEQIEGTYYRLPFYYEPISSFEDQRIFNYVEAVYVAKGNKIQYSTINIDNDKNIVSFLSI